MLLIGNWALTEPLSAHLGFVNLDSEVGKSGDFG